jgi:hypothetical protein
MKKLFLIVSAVVVIIAFTSCTKDSVDPTNSVTSNSKNTSTSSNGSTPTGTSPSTTVPVNTVPTIDDANLQGSWSVVSDSCYWAGELPKYLVSAYKGKTGDHFNFSKNSKLYIHEDGLSDTTTYSVDTTHRITVTFADARHFDEKPGFGFGLDPVGFDPTISASFFQKSVDANTLILNYFQCTPDGAASRVIYLKR